MHEGILPSMALHRLASVRINTKEILDKVRKEMAVDSASDRTGWLGVPGSAVLSPPLVIGHNRRSLRLRL